MAKLDSIKCDKPMLIHSGFMPDGTELRLYLNKSFFKDQSIDQYFIKAFTRSGHDKHFKCQGYIYFYLNEQLDVSLYIGSLVKDEFRSSGLGSLLISAWIRWCFENGFEDLTTTKAQRKPFLLYMLKKYNFDLQDTDLYLTSGNNIHICRREKDKRKLLLFDNKRQGLSFARGKIYRGDNYHIIDELTPEVQKLDTVLLSEPYEVKQPELAYQRSLRKIDDLIK